MNGWTIEAASTAQVVRQTDEVMVGEERIDVDDLFRSQHVHLVRLAALLTGSPDVAQDVVADIFARLLRRPDTRIEDPPAYLRRCVINEVNSRGRRITRRRRISAGIAAEPSVDSAQEGPIVERDRVLAALAELPARQRAVLVLRHFEDMSESETAAVLGIAPGTVKSAGARGAARLRELLSEDDR